MHTSQYQSNTEEQTLVGLRKDTVLMTQTSRSTYMYIECIVFGKMFQLLKNTDQRGSVKVFLYSPFTP